MDKFATVTSRVVPLPLRDVDTDLIIPAQYLTRVSKSGYGDALFRRLRDSDPAFVLNDSRYDGAEILVADANFGCGSSREHAVWALRDYGFRVVIAKSFADIFASNSAKNGLLLVTLPPNEVDHILTLATSESGASLSVDLQAETVSVVGGAQYGFSTDPFVRHCLLEGLDELDYILAFKESIAEFRTRQQSEVR